MIRAEMDRRFGEEARIHYHNVSRPEVAEKHAEIVGAIEENGLLYPVTVIEGTPVYDGAVSYPAILRTVQNLLDERRS